MVNLNAPMMVIHEALKCDGPIAFSEALKYERMDPFQCYVSGNPDP
jgi:hypothetical protein